MMIPEFSFDELVAIIAALHFYKDAWEAVRDNSTNSQLEPVISLALKKIAHCDSALAIAHQLIAR
jgi:hypothetical protein